MSEEWKGTLEWKYLQGKQTRFGIWLNEDNLVPVIISRINPFTGEKKQSSFFNDGGINKLKTLSPNLKVQTTSQSYSKQTSGKKDLMRQLGI